MNDCQNVAVREALPDLVHGVLAEAERAGVLRHLDGCTDCAGELAIIRSVLALSISVTPRVNTGAISVAIPAYHEPVPAHATIQGRHRFGVAQLRLAAALVLGAVGVSALVLEHQSSSAKGDAVAAVTSVAHNASVASPAGARSGVALVGTADLTDAHLAQLIQSMAHIDAVPPVEPDPIVPVAYEVDAS